MKNKDELNLININDTENHKSPSKNHNATVLDPLGLLKIEKNAIGYGMLMNQSVLQKDKEIGRSVKYTIQRLTDDIFFLIQIW